jgi:predicted glycosyltransferase
MKKIMFYCQYLAGMGHLVRSTEVSRALTDKFQVCFVNGGQPIAEFKFPSELEVQSLPPILEEEGKLKSTNGSSIEAVKTARKNQLLEIFDQFQPDCLIIECFPFSKHKLKFELIPLLDRVKASPYPIKTVCSLRDLIMTQNFSAETLEKRSNKICDLVNRYFDLVLVHSDPQLVKLEEQFSKIDRLNCEVFYTGYVAPSLEPSSVTDVDKIALNQEKPIVVVSAGGGRFGYELISATVNACKILETQIPHRFQIFTGPFMPENQVEFLQSIADSNVTVRHYTTCLNEYLKRADLSISLGGYNTTMDILKTKVRSLVFPEASEEQTGEQTIRAKKLAEKGILQLLHRVDLQPDRLAQKILEALQQPLSQHQFDLQGAARSTQRLQELLNESSIAA